MSSRASYEPGLEAVGLTTATTRALLGPSEGAGGRAELVARRLGSAIRLGLLLDGERLPTEIQLASQLGVSTVTLREALSTLREQDLVVTRRGRGGGTFVRAPADLGELLHRFGVQDLRDLGDQRRAVAGTAAYLAAERALPEEIRRLEEQLERLDAVGTASERRRAYTELGIAIAAAAQSPRLTSAESQLRAEVGDLLVLELDEGDHEAVVRDRRLLIGAIAARRPDQARDLAEAQVEHETARLIGLRLQMAPVATRRRRVRAADEVLGDVVEELDHVLAELDKLGAELGAVVGRTGQRPRREELEALRPTIFAMLQTHGDLLNGAGVITAPDLLADAPHWLEWWWIGERGALEPLRVNLDPLAPDFYDYTLADWYATPARTLRPRIAGPFVDYACTNEYNITLSSPVQSATEDLVGVAAADVLVSSIERRVLPTLAALDHPVALTSADGRVIVSNSASHLPGQRLTVSADTARPAQDASPVRSLLLIDLPTVG